MAKLWVDDTFDYSNERRRVLLSTAILLCAYTASRPRSDHDFLRKADLPWSKIIDYLSKDVLLYNSWNMRGEPEFRVKFQYRVRKFRSEDDKRQPCVYINQGQNSNQKLTVYRDALPIHENNQLGLNLALYILMIGVAEDAFQGSLSIQYLFDLRPSPGQQLRHIPWKQAWADTPFLRYESQGCPIKYKDYQQMLKALGEQCEYQIAVTTYQFRRESANAVAEHVSPAKLSQFLGHRDLRATWRQVYLSKISDIDVQNKLLGKDSDMNWVNEFRTISQFREAPDPDLPRRPRYHVSQR